MDRIKVNKNVTYAYETVTQQTVEELKSLLGIGNVFSDEHDREAYSQDEMPVAKPHPPQVIVKPSSTESIAALLQFANRKRIPVTPRGAGTGVSGGCIPIYSGIVLSLERMNRILEIDSNNFTATVEPGVTLTDLHNALDSYGLYYPLRPGELSATIGGNVSTNAGGMNAVKHGVTRHHVLGLEAVIPTGETIHTGGKFVKCSTGYDLTQLITGSEGTLAVVTKIILKLTTRPEKREVLFVPFTSLQNAIDAVPEILKLNIGPVGLEFMERDIIQIVERHLNIEIPHHQHDAFLMIITEGQSETEITDYFSSVERICKQHGAIEAVVPGSERAKRRLLEARENFYHAIKKVAMLEIIDVVVPRSEIARFVKRVKELSRQHAIPVIAYGHAGDGNVHLHPMCVNMQNDEWGNKLPELMKDIYRAGVDFGGSISGEHGIGFDKKRYIDIGIDKETLSLMKNIKRAFDPNNILNPGKIFDLHSG
jgi:glycolate oxidase